MQLISIFLACSSSLPPVSHKLAPGRNNQDVQLEQLDLINKHGTTEQRLLCPKRPSRRGQTKAFELTAYFVTPLLTNMVFTPASSRKHISLVWIVVTVTLWPNAVTWGVLKSINKWATEILWKPGARQLWDEVSQNPEHLFSITQLEKVKSCLKTHQHYCKHLLPESTKNPLAKSIGGFLPRRCFRLAVFKHLTHSLDMA